jgi:hypothetical protein
MCNKYRVELHQATLAEVTILPTGKFNLIIKNNGWILGADNDTMWLVNSEKKR